MLIVKRVKPGEYVSECGRVQIIRVLDTSPLGRRRVRGTSPKPLVLWHLYVDGRDMDCEETLRDAVAVADKEIRIRTLAESMRAGEFNAPTLNIKSENC